MAPTVGRGAMLSSLAGAASKGDRSAFTRLVIETSPQIYALAFRLLGNEQDARDVVQETYLRAFRSIGKFRGDAAVTTWLHRITANCCATHLERRRATPPIGNEAELAFIEQRSERDPEEAAGALDDRAALLGALNRLPSATRAVVVLHDVYDLSHAAIAAELGISRTASKVRLHRARRQLHALLFVPLATAVAGSGAPAPVSIVRPMEGEPSEEANVHAL